MKGIIKKINAKHIVVQVACPSCLTEHVVETNLIQYYENPNWDRFKKIQYCELCKADFDVPPVSLRDEYGNT